MKRHLLGIIACVFLTSCASTPPSPKRTPVSTAKAKPVGAAVEHAVAAPAEKTRSSAAPKLRFEKPYAMGALPERLTFTPAEIEEMKADIRARLRADHRPTGPELVLYDEGVTTLDHWLHYGPSPLTKAPATPSHYRLIYRDGYTVESYRHDAAGVRLAQKIYYAEGMMPACSINYDQNGEPRSYAHLTYDDRGMIKRVVVIDRHGAPLHAVCRAHRDVYLNGEYKTYRPDRDGRMQSHTIHEDSVIYTMEAGERKQRNLGSELRTMLLMEKHGLRPFYPLPAGFVPPSISELEPWKAKSARP